MLVGAAFVLLAIIGLLGYGWFSTSYQPPRRTVAEVGNEKIKLADVVPYAVLTAVNTQAALRPDLALNVLLGDALLRQRSGELDVVVTSDEIDQMIVDRFEPRQAGATETIDTLTAVGQDLFETFLEDVNVSEEDYRSWAEGLLLQQEVRAHFDSLQPEETEQVFVEWIVTASSVTALQAFERVDRGEDFSVVAEELNIERTLTAPNGELGWVPRGAIPDLDLVVFDSELERDTLVGPLVTSLGSVVLRITDGPSEQPLSDVMSRLASASVFQGWMDEQADQLVQSGSGLDSGDIDWVLDRYR